MDQERGIQKMSAPSAPAQPAQDRGGDLYCPICGRDRNPSLNRFGHFFCSEAHVAQYANERLAKTDSVAPASPAVAAKDQREELASAPCCGMGTKGGLKKMGWCLAGGLGLLIAIPLIASGGLAATAGSLLSVAAFLACPIGMYFMMRAMMKGQHSEPPDKKGGER